jgi:hypothetical protein
MNLITSIESFNFKLGGYFSSIYEISYEKNIVTYVAKSSPYDKGLKYEKEISSESIEVFKSKLNKLKLINWKNKYLNYNVLDGEEWHLAINFNNSIKKRIDGINDYPGNVSNINDRTEVFNEFLLALNVLIQESDFFQMNS